MAYDWTDDGRDIVEEVITDSNSTQTLDTIVIGTASNAPNTGDQSLDQQVYESTASSGNVTIERGSGAGEIRTLVEVTGGNEVPAGADLYEFGFKSSDGTLLYREVRDSPIEISSGETKIIEIRPRVEDNPSDGEQVITTIGREYVADRLIGNTSAVINTIAIGSGTGTVSPEDTTLSNEKYRGVNSDDNITLTGTSSAGDIRAKATISAGSDFDDNVAAGASVSEFGLLTDDNRLVLHEKRTGLTVENNDTKTFSIPFTIIQ
jgi:hypothetical protein